MVEFAGDQVLKFYNSHLLELTWTCSGEDWALRWRIFAFYLSLQNQFYTQYDISWLQRRRMMTSCHHLPSNKCITSRRPRKRQENRFVSRALCQYKAGFNSKRTLRSSLEMSGVGTFAMQKWFSLNSISWILMDFAIHFLLPCHINHITRGKLNVDLVTKRRQKIWSTAREDECPSHPETDDMSL